MVKLKLPHNESIEALLKIIEGKEEIRLDNDGQDAGDSYDFDNDALSFLQAFKIEAGNTPIRTTLMYRIYKQWSRNPVRPASFSIKIGKFIPRNHTGQYYMIAANIFNFTKITKELLNHKFKRRKRRINIAYFNKMFEFYGIKTGNLWLEGYILHYLYIEWCDDNRRKMQYNYYNFMNTMKAFFPFRMNEKATYFRVDEQILKHLPQTKLDALRKKTGRSSGRKKEK